MFSIFAPKTAPSPKITKVEKKHSTYSQFIRSLDKKEVQEVVFKPNSGIAEYLTKDGEVVDAQSRRQSGIVEIVHPLRRGRSNQPGPPAGIFPRKLFNFSRGVFLLRPPPFHVWHDEGWRWWRSHDATRIRHGPRSHHPPLRRRGHRQRKERIGGNRDVPP
jgi:hypothetical protein